MAHWFSADRRLFVPWHLDNMFLDMLVERGVVELLVFAMPVTCAPWELTSGQSQPLVLLSPYPAASSVSLASSRMDGPRVALLLLFLALFPIHDRAVERLFVQ